MTLLMGMSKPEGIYLSVDYRVTDARTGKLIDDAATKNLTIHYPPLDQGGPKVLLGFTGLAILRDGTPTLTWIRETLRGETEVIDQSMAHLRTRLNRDIAPYRVPLRPFLRARYLPIRRMIPAGSIKILSVGHSVATIESADQLACRVLTRPTTAHVGCVPKWT
jgi:hypothetical protein